MRTFLHELLLVGVAGIVVAIGLVVSDFTLRPLLRNLLSDQGKICIVSDDPRIVVMVREAEHGCSALEGRRYCTTRELASHASGYRGMRTSEEELQSFAEEHGTLARAIFEGSFRIEGVTEIRMIDYCVSIDKEISFEWKNIEPQVVVLLKKVILDQSLSSVSTRLPKEEEVEEHKD